MRLTKKQQLYSIEDIVESRRLGNNTVEYITSSGDRIIRYYHTDILTFKPDGSIVFNSDGWNTFTTKERMNIYQSQARIFQYYNYWFLTMNHYVYSFFDGITIKDGKVINKKDPDYEAIKYSIDEYIYFFSSSKIEIKNTIGLEDRESLLKYINLNIYYKNIILNALQEAGYTERILEYGIKHVIKRCLGRYLRKRLLV